MEIADLSQWELDKLEREHEGELLHAKLGLREELAKKHQRHLTTRDEMIELLKVKLPTSVEKTSESGVHSSGGASAECDSLDESGRGVRLKLPTLPWFDGDDREDDSLRRWLAKLEKHAELQNWTEHENGQSVKSLCNSSCI